MLAIYRTSFALRLLLVSVLLLGCLVGGLALRMREHAVSATSLTATAAASPSTSLPNLQGDAAKQYLQQHGLYSSLGAAMAAARYAVFPVEDTEQAKAGEQFYLHNPAQHYRAFFSTDSVRLEMAEECCQSGGQWAMQLSGAGYGERLLEVGPGALSVKADRVEYQRTVGSRQWAVGSEPDASRLTPHASLTEWYINRPSGLEQGFTLDEPPGEREGAEALRLRLSVSGKLKAELSRDGVTVLLKGERGKVVMRYSEVKAWDAAQRVLPAKLVAKRGEIGIEVDDRGAQYPVTIDPVITTQVAKLKALTPGADDEFGYAVAISGDTAIVGARYENNPKPLSGGAYIFERNRDGANQWGLVQRLQVISAAANDNFGTSVAISGDTVIVGAIGESTTQFASGAAYIFERNYNPSAPGTPLPNNWGEVKKLKASTPGNANFFGYAVAISGDTVIVGESDEDTGQNNSGAAYIFERNYNPSAPGTPLPNNWGQVKMLKASTPGQADGFGSAVGISGDTAIVGASGEDTTQPSSGAAYIFERNTGSANNWGQVKMLKASTRGNGDGFGLSVGISGSTVIVGVPGEDTPLFGSGAAYIFERNFDPLHPGTPLPNNWGEVKKLKASPPGFNDRFGFAVGISDDTVVVGAQGESTTQHFSGAAYIFERNIGGADQWGQAKMLKASMPGDNDQFGYSVGISGDTVIIGAPQESTTQNDSGAAYIFSNTCDQWVQIDRQTASTPHHLDKFGYAVGVSGSTAIVGAYNEDTTQDDSGAAYIFERNTGGGDQWSLVKMLKASTPGSYDQFGFAVAISGDRVIIGAPGQDVPYVDSGAAYIFERNKNGPDQWGQVQMLQAIVPHAYDQFGYSVGISGSTVIVGAPFQALIYLDAGAAYIFERNKNGADQWGQVQMIKPISTAAFDHFGYSVGISGPTAIVGAIGEDTAAEKSGAAYIFERNKNGADQWGQVKMLKALSPSANSQFGWSVGVSGATAIIGAPLESTTHHSAGAAYLFERNFNPNNPASPVANNWGQVKMLKASTPGQNDEFGYAVGVSGATAIVGAIGEPTIQSNSGAAYIFKRNKNGADQWGEVQMLKASTPGFSYQFGNAVGISDDTAIVGAPFETDSGASSIFVINCPPVIAPATISREQAAGPSNSTIATVVDDLTPASNLMVTLNGALPTGISVTNLVYTNGTLTADVAAGCNASPGVNVVSLKATDGHGAFSTANFFVNVISLTPVANAGPDQTKCQHPSGTTQFTLNGTATGGTPQWSFVSATGSITPAGVNILNPTSATTNVNVTGSGTVKLRLTVTTVCNVTHTDDVVLTVNPLPNCSITGPYSVTAFSTGNSYSAPAGANLAYSWTISGSGTFAGGGTMATTTSVSVNAGNVGLFTLQLTVTNTLTGCSSLCYQAVIVNRPLVSLKGDYDGDGQTDLAIWRPSNATFYIYSPATGSTTKQWGNGSDIPVPGDYDGDGKTDIALWRPATGVWLVCFSSNGTTPNWQWGMAGDVPVPGDYDGDGKTDLAIWRPSTGVWWIYRSSNFATMTSQWGVPGDVPVPGDYTGDGRTDLAVQRLSNATFYVYDLAIGSSTTKQWGAAGDIPAIGDYDGDGKIDIAVWRPATATFIISQSSNGAMVTGQWGAATDIPTPGDYDGDGKTDLTIWRPLTGVWWVFRSSNFSTMTTQWGTFGDVPIS